MWGLCVCTSTHTPLASLPQLCFLVCSSSRGPKDLGPDLPRSLGPRIQLPRRPTPLSGPWWDPGSGCHLPYLLGTLLLLHQQCRLLLRQL